MTDIKPEYLIEVKITLSCAHGAEEIYTEEITEWTDAPEDIDLKKACSEILEGQISDDSGGVDPTNGFVCKKCIEEWKLDIGFGPGLMFNPDDAAGP
jgi:hypothetical protein